MSKTTDDFIVQNQLTLMNDCFSCLQLDELCDDCLEAKEARDAIIANEMVENGMDTYRYFPMYTSLSKIQEQPSGHDWTERDGELKEQIYDITNRLQGWLFLGKHIVPLVQQDELSAYLRLPSTDTICIQCHLQVNRFVGCQSCITPSQSLYNEIHKVMCS
jgi:hypothetical protein